MSGHLEQRGGRWRVTVDVGLDPITNRRRRVSRTMPKGATKKDALDEAARLRLEARGGPPAAKTITVGELIDRWLEHVEGDLSPTTVQGYRSKIECYLRPAFGALPARKLTADRIDALYRQMRKKGIRGNELSPATVRRTHAALTRACDQAVKWGWLPKNPCDTADAGRQIKNEIEPPTIEEISRVLEHCDENARDAIGLALATGARRGELCGLQWADIDLAGAQVTFRRAVGDVGGQAVVIEHRRKSRIRTLSIDAPTVDALRARHARAAKLSLECGKALPPTGFVLADAPGQAEPLRPQKLTQRWRLAAKHAGVDARLHDVRHWNVTELLLANTPIPNVVARAGWASPQMLGVYAHAIASADRDASDAISRARAR